MAPEIREGAASSSSSGVVPGPYHDEMMVCQFASMNTFSGSIWFGNSPLAFSTPVLMLQLILIFFISRPLHLFLKPLGQSQMTAQIIAGIIMGPSFLARDTTYREHLLPPGCRLILRTVADVGFMFHLFLLGVQIDASMFKKVTRTSLLIATIGFTLSYLLASIAWFSLSRMTPVDEGLIHSLPLLITLNSVSSFPVITSILADLNILNSEMGRLATFTAMIADMWCVFVGRVGAKLALALRTSEWSGLWSILWGLIYVVIVAYVFRPWLLRMSRQIDEQKLMTDSHVISILGLVLICGLLSEIMGTNAGYGAFVLGLAVPEGPPVGENLVYKLEAVSSGLFLPVKYAFTGMSMDLLSVRNSKGMVIELVIAFGYIGKFLGTLLTGLYCRLPGVDAMSLALIMCCKGIVDIHLCDRWRDNGVLDKKEYTLMIITMLIVSGLARPLVGHLYDPSTRYMIPTRGSLLQSIRNHDIDLRILVCIHTEDNVPAMINLLEASNPTKDNPLSVFVLSLMELKGRAISVLVPNYQKGTFSSKYDHSSRIVEAFNQYTQSVRGSLCLEHFTALAPYSSMHDDICMLAVDKRVTLVIVPYHKQWTIDGTVGAVFPCIRVVNQNVTNKAPCSVGVLVDRTQEMGGSWSLSTRRSLFRVAMLFLDGADDREALTYARRMADHPQVTLTTVWIRQALPHGRVRTTIEDKFDVSFMNEFDVDSKGKGKVTFKEEMVEDAEGTTRVIRSMKEDFDLFVVGRHHEPDSPLVSGLIEWSECPELGVIGDLLVTSDFGFSVLVVQQQPPRAAFPVKRSLKWLNFGGSTRSSVSLGSGFDPYRSYMYTDHAMH
ncbi:cation/H(+) antiporter 14 [Diospyros lotus]|uniref:cation/H(+) antiporter 14 n=1 Tax=Diospyros lotus TaxID=55363 RepID=UPI002259FC53|nr:cation/H(+) antiporter 14 [Diospyros lotus]